MAQANNNAQQALKTHLGFFYHFSHVCQESFHFCTVLHVLSSIVPGIYYYLVLPSFPLLFFCIPSLYFLSTLPSLSIFSHPFWLNFLPIFLPSPWLPSKLIPKVSLMRSALRDPTIPLFIQEGPLQTLPEKRKILPAWLSRPPNGPQPAPVMNSTPRATTSTSITRWF